MLVLLFALACGPSEPAAPRADAPEATAPLAAPVAEAPAPTTVAVRAPLDVGCPSALVAHYEAAFAKQCALERLDGSIGLVPRILRNVPFAARGYHFNSDALRAFFAAAKQGCEAAWYVPAGTAVELPAPELECAKAFKLQEAALDRDVAVPDYVEDYLLATHAEQLLTEVARHLGQGRPGHRLIVTESADGTWTLNFYMEDKVDGETFESAVVVTCREGRCETMFAG